MIENIDRLIKLVRERFPNWESFSDSQFVEEEIDYKKKSIAKARDKLSETVMK